MSVGRILLDGAFIALAAVVAVEMIVLLDVLRRAVRVKAELYAAMPGLMKQERLAGGTFVDFEAPDLVTGAPLHSADLRGAPAALLFMAPRESERPAGDWLQGTIAGLRYKGEGRLLILCDGSRAACSELAREVGPEVQVLVDEEGGIRGRFLVHATPAAVLLDSEARVAQYGMPEQIPDWEEEVV